VLVAELSRGGKRVVNAKELLIGSFVNSGMSHKSKERKARESFPAPARAGTPPDFEDFERRAERHAARHEELRYRLAPDCKVHIQFNGIATQEALRKLIRYLEMGIDDFPKNVDDSPTNS
jgi:hypothetical protein